MACLYKRRKQYWISYYIGGKQVQKSLHTSSEKVATSTMISREAKSALWFWRADLCR